MKSNKFIRLGLLFFILLLMGTRQVAAQAQSQYVLDLAHPAYSTGNTFSADPEFLRGWCFAWDATSPIVQFGAQVKIFRRTIDMSPPTQTFPVTIWSSGQFYVTVDVEVKRSMGMTLEFMSVSPPNTSLFYQNAVGIRAYADNLPDLEKQFWYGYAACLELAGYNPNFLLITPGNTI